jgi:hypothetical protein
MHSATDTNEAENPKRQSKALPHSSGQTWALKKHRRIERKALLTGEPRRARNGLFPIAPLC